MGVGQLAQKEELSPAPELASELASNVSEPRQRLRVADRVKDDAEEPLTDDASFTARSQETADGLDITSSEQRENTAVRRTDRWVKKYADSENASSPIIALKTKAKAQNLNNYEVRDQADCPACLKILHGMLVFSHSLCKQGIQENPALPLRVPIREQHTL